jgi:hypothetical protein
VTTEPPTGRARRGGLGTRVRLFAVGAGLGVGGIALENRWLIWGAILVLGAGFALRFLADSGGPPSEDSGSDRD